ncbi:hypothetical protein ACPEEZ_03920 [Frigoribacterium sp. 2-23]|uniref:hypothetical protein n=1 Tax=Frigoribacterium sp. 2-23 TaxID=3415006 RepID=UPI003C704E2B
MISRRTARRVRSSGRWIAPTLLAALALSVLSPAAVFASPTPDPTFSAPSPTPPAAVAPTIDDVGNRSTNSVTVTGTGTPGAALRILDPSVPSASLCTTTVAASDSASAPWSCRVTLPNGAGLRLTVRDTTNATDDATTGSFSVLGAPTVTGGLLVGAKASGTGYPGATVSVSATGGATTTATVGSGGAWEAILPAGAFPSGTYALQATQSSAAIPAVPTSSASSPVSATVDRDAPSAPTVTSPGAGSTISAQPVTFRGQGEDGAIVTVYVDSSPVCQSRVVSGAWQCTSTGSSLPDGARDIQAAQVDAAGNYGPPSTALRVTVRNAPADSAPAASAPSTPTPTPSKSASPSPTPAPTDGAVPPPSAAGTPPGQSGTAPGVPGRGGGGSGPSGAAGSGTWATATSFGRDLPTLAQTIGTPAWPAAIALGVLFLVLIAAPSRLASAAARGRWHPLRARLTGRNRSVEVPTGFNTGTISPWVAVGVTIAAGAAITALAAGVDDEVQYARMAAGIVLGLLVVNGVCLVLPAAVLARRRGLPLRLRVSPGLVLAAVAAAGATRLLGLDPPLLVGVLVAAGLSTVGLGRDAVEPTPRDRGTVALAQLGLLTVLPFAAWMLHGVVGLDGGFWSQLGRETMATICLAGLGSLVLLLLPLGALPGRALWAMSRPAYLVTALAGVTAASIVFVGNPVSGFPIGPLVVVAASCAAIAVAAWLWVRFVEPTRADF